MIRRPCTSAEPRVSVVIPTLPGRDYDGVVAALRDQTAEAFEVLVVEDGSLDICEARNEGIRAAGGDVVALTDDDCRPPADWVATVASAFERHPEAVCVEGPVRGGRTYGGERMYVGCNLAFDRSTALDAGGFRSEYAGWRDDTEFGWRMESRGECRYVEGMAMAHPPATRASIDAGTERRLRREYPDRYEELVVPETALGRINDWLWRKGFWRFVDRFRYRGVGGA